jgi:hypothetical protein
MLFKNIKKLLMIVIVSGFVSTSFAAWTTQKGYTACKGGTCHHSTVKKGCVNGNCGAVKHSSTWHR